MAISCKTIVYCLGLFSLLFIAIPVTVDEPRAVTEERFLQYIQQHNKSYNKSSPEYTQRYENFKTSFHRATKANRSRPTNNVAYGINKFSDLSAEEFREKVLRHRPSSPSCLKKYSKNSENPLLKVSPVVANPLPSHIDWRDKKVVTEVKNQKDCGACWAFSIVETIESMYAIATGVLKELSTQQVIDCATFGNLGCLGGDTCTALNWMDAASVALLTDKEYPSTLKDQTCRTPPKYQEGIHILSNYSCYNMVGDEQEMKSILALHGPVAAAVDASTWQDYLGGIIQFNCDAEVNHAVEVVGYDIRESVPYYILRNSWGTDYGINGYLHVAMGNNLCGIAREVAVLDVQV